MVTLGSRPVIAIVSRAFWTDVLALQTQSCKAAKLESRHGCRGRIKLRGEQLKKFSHGSGSRTCCTEGGLRRRGLHSTIER